MGNRMIVKGVNVQSLLDVLIKIKHDGVEHIAVECTNGDEGDTMKFLPIGNHPDLDEFGFLTDECINRLLNNKN